MPVRPLLPALLLAAATPLPAQEEPAAAAPAPKAASSIATFFPADSFFHLGVDDLSEWRAAWARSAWGKLWDDEGSGALRQSAATFLEALAKQSKDEFGLDVVDTFSLLRGRAGLALAKPEAAEAADPSGEWLVVLDAGEHAAELDARLARVVEKMAEQDTEQRKTVRKFEQDGDVQVSIVQNLVDGAAKDEMRFAAAAGEFVVTVAAGPSMERGTHGRALGVARGTPIDSLAEHAHFTGSLADQPGGLKAWLDTRRLLRPMARDVSEMLGAGSTPESGAAAEKSLDDLLGVEQLGALAARLAVDEYGMRLDAHQAWTGKGAFAQVIDAWAGEGDDALYRLMPAATTFALALAIDFPRGFEVTEELRKELGAPPLMEEPPEGATNPDGTPVFAPKRDLIDHLDGRFAFFAAPVEEEERLMLPLPGVEEFGSVNVALLIGLRNAEALRATLDRQLREVGLHAARKSTEFQGFRVESVPAAPGFTIHYCILDDLLVASLAPSLVQDVLRRRGDGELPGLAKAPEFARSWSALGHRPAFSMFTSVSDQLRSGAGAVSANERLSALGYAEEGDESAEPPPQDPVEAAGLALLDAIAALDPAVIAKHVPKGSIGALAVDGTGVHLELVSR